jgi:hypothetical protein
VASSPAAPGAKTSPSPESASSRARAYHSPLVRSELSCSQSCLRRSSGRSQRRCSYTQPDWVRARCSRRRFNVALSRPSATRSSASGPAQNENTKVGTDFDRSECRTLASKHMAGRSGGADSRSLPPRGGKLDPVLGREFGDERMTLKSDLGRHLPASLVVSNGRMGVRNPNACLAQGSRRTRPITAPCPISEPRALERQHR